MSLEHALLGFLSREPETGYDLKTRGFDRELAHCWNADQAQVYRTLERLRERRLVTSRNVPQRGKPDRRVFSITESGREELSRWLGTSETPRPPRDPFLLHLFFSAELADTNLLRLLAEARCAYQQRLDVLRATAAHALRAGRDAQLHRMTLEASMASARAAVDWLDDTMDKVRAGLGTNREGA